MEICYAGFIILASGNNKSLYVMKMEIIDGMLVHSVKRAELTWAKDGSLYGVLEEVRTAEMMYYSSRIYIYCSLVDCQVNFMNKMLSTWFKVWNY